MITAVLPTAAKTKLTNQKHKTETQKQQSKIHQQKTHKSQEINGRMSKWWHNHTMGNNYSSENKLDYITNMNKTIRQHSMKENKLQKDRKFKNK